MLLRDVFVELRPRLRSCNVFLTFRSFGLDLRLDVRPGEICVSYESTERSSIRCKIDSTRKYSTSSVDSSEGSYIDDTEVIVVNVEEFCRFIPNSISGLKVNGNCVFFRVLIEGNTGDFYSEVVNNVETETRVSRIDIAIERDEGVKFLCRNCSRKIGEATFQRVLELPSSSIDRSEWFCHDHGESERNDHNHADLSPRDSDLFFGLLHVVINPSILNDAFAKFNASRNVYHCDRCLAWLGTKDDESAKFYNSTTTTQSKNIFNLASTPQIDFIKTIIQLVSESSIGLQYSITTKLLLKSTFSQTTTKHLLIWIIEKNLQTLTSGESLSLTSKQTYKLLYLLEDTITDTVVDWQNDSFVTSFDVSKNMMLEGLDYLREMSLRVPESMRKSNGFSLSYLFCD